MADDNNAKQLHGAPQSLTANFLDDTARHDVTNVPANDANLVSVGYTPQLPPSYEDRDFHHQFPASYRSQTTWSGETLSTADRSQARLQFNTASQCPASQHYGWGPRQDSPVFPRPRTSRESLSPDQSAKTLDEVGKDKARTPQAESLASEPPGRSEASAMSESGAMETALESKRKEPGIAGLTFIKPDKSYFEIGTVFWAEIPELAGPPKRSSSQTDSESSDAESVMSTESGNPISSKGRLYVVVQRRQDHCVVLGCFTHGGQGVSKPHCRKSDFCIIYTGDVAPTPMPREKPRPSRREGGMRARALRVLPTQRAATLGTGVSARALDPLSLKPTTRLNLGKEYSPIDYGKLRLQHFGVLDGQGKIDLGSQWRAVRQNP